MESIKAMSVQDRLKLIEAIWQTMDEDMLEEDQQELSLLEERLQKYKMNPDKTMSREEVKAALA